MQIHEAILWTMRRSRQRFRAAVAFSLSFKLLQAALITPLVAISLRLLLQRWGRASVGNFEIAAFLLSPPGFLAVFGIGSVSLACVYLEVAGLMRLVADDRLAWWQALLSAGRLIPRLVQLGMRQLVFYLLLLVPFLGGIGLAYGWFWSSRDLNGLIILRPAEFWWGAGVAAFLLLAYISLVCHWFLRWLLAVPTLLFEPGLSVRSAMQLSAERMAGRRMSQLRALAMWLMIQLALNLAGFWLLRLLSATLLDLAGDALNVTLPVTAGLLILHGLLAALLSVFATLTLAGLVLVAYQQAVGAPRPDSTLPVFANRRSPAWVLAGGAMLFAGAMTWLSHQLLDSIPLHERVEITAHRAGAMHAPENSVAALRLAIQARADWAEIDVQLTKDKQLVVMHDIDLARIGGGNRRVEAVNLAEIQALDIGAPVGPEFTGERVPKLEAILAAAGQDIRLNVELKPHGARDEIELTQRVLDALRKARLLDRSRLCSQSYASLQLARRLEPSLPLGFIAGASLGDLTRLDVDFLMVKSELATRSLIEKAATRRIGVHAWTVNDPARLASLIDRGVANVITDDPGRMRTRLEEVVQLSPGERLLLRARSELLGTQE